MIAWSNLCWPVSAHLRLIHAILMYPSLTRYWPWFHFILIWIMVLASCLHSISIFYIWSIQLCISKADKSLQGRERAQWSDMFIAKLDFRCFQVSTAFWSFRWCEQAKVGLTWVNGVCDWSSAKTVSPHFLLLVKSLKCFKILFLMYVGPTICNKIVTFNNSDAWQYVAVALCI